MAQAHVARDRQARPGLGQARGIEAVLFEQWLWVMAVTGYCVRQAMDETYGQVTQAHRLLHI
jgi:hypothetical protein